MVDKSNYFAESASCHLPSRLHCTMAQTRTSDTGRRISDIRRFNRFYTQRIGALQEGLLDSAFSLAEARVLYELAHWGDAAGSGRAQRLPSASRLAARLDIDEGYLSRLLRGFEQRRLIARKSSPDDGRENILALTPEGRKAFAPLDLRSRRQVAAMLSPLADGERTRLVAAMATIEQVLGRGATGTRDRRDPAYTLRALQPGDIGWVTHRHGVLYAREYGYDERFEALVGDIAAKFVQELDPKRERCWIAECDGEILGCVFLVSKSPTIAKLRLLLVEPAARGLGLGARLVDECIAFARAAGYRKIVLWTQSELLAARRIYERRGFRRIAEEPHHSFGRDLVAETWELRMQRHTATESTRGKRVRGKART
jgi:DNA-binding MarR family transcriptional regulator/N-acetylglutamate synthase-like GNAT family acetyltransferase